MADLGEHLRLKPVGFLSLIAGNQHLFLALFQAARHAVKSLSHHAKFILVAHLDRVIQIPLTDAVNAGLQPLERVEDQHNQQMVDQ